VKALLQRLAGLLATLFAVHAACFFLLRSARGGPFDAGRSWPAEVEAALRAQYHLDEPLLLQYLRSLGQILRGDFGPSLRYRDVNVNTILAEAIPVSLALGAAALLVAVLLSVPAGVFAATRKASGIDRSLLALSTLTLSTPSFVIAGLLVAIFSFGLGAFPPAGLQDVRSLVLPVFCLALPTAAQLLRLARHSALEVLEGEGPRAARARGLRESRVRRRHILRPSAAPLLAFLGPSAAALLTGSLVVEQVFALPGLGTHFVQAALNRDYTLALGITLIYTALLGVLTMLGDWAMSRIDPRVEALGQS